MSEHRHIAVIIHSLGGGGAERTLVDLASAWRARGDLVTIITLSDAKDDAYVLHPAINRLTLDVAGSSDGFLQALLANAKRVMRLRRVIKSTRPDVLIGFMTTSSVLALLASIGLQIKVFASEHTHPPFQAISALWRRLRVLTYVRAQAVIALTEGTAQWLSKQMPRARVKVIPNPVNWPVSNVEPKVTPPAMALNRKRLLAVGRLHAEKGFDLLIQAFEKVAFACPQWDLVILGEGAEREALQALIQARGLRDRVTMPGRVGNMADWYANSKMYVLSSRVEGLSNTLLEAMAMGLPVVAFDCDTGPREIIRNSSDGVLVKPNGDVEALARELIHLMSDQTRQQQLSLSGQHVRERFALSTILARWDHVFEEVV